MAETDFLFTVAEVAATFAGFSTLVVVVQQQFSGGGSALVAARLISMLSQSLLAILFCLLPFLPEYAGLSTSASWRLSSGLFCLAWLAYYLNILLRIRARGIFSAMSIMNRLNVFATHPVAIVVLGLGALGLWNHHTGLVYLCCILGLLALCGFLFLQQVLAIANARSDA